MRLIDISHDPRTTYRLTEDEQAVFFMLNRTDEVAIELAGPGAAAHVFAFFIGTGTSVLKLALTQHHLAPQATSSSLMKSVLTGTSRLQTESIIRIDRPAHQSNASHESRSLLLSEDAHASTRPALEIEADDVTCRHAATTSPLNPHQRLYAKSRGLTESEADELLVRGFFGEALERIAALGIATAPLEKLLFTQLHALYARQ